jgi:hypothetical protein
VSNKLKINPEAIKHIFVRIQVVNNKQKRGVYQVFSIQENSSKTWNSEEDGIYNIFYIYF